METEKMIRIGGLGPLSLPGIPWAGRELQDGMALAVKQLNDSGGVLGRPLALLFEDTSGHPEAGVTDAVQVPFLSYTRPGHLTSQGKQMWAEFEKRYGREPTFVALEGYDAVVVLAHAFEDAGTTEPTKIRDALNRIEVEGTRETIRFSTEPTGMVHQQWKWPPVSVVAYSCAHQALLKADVLWDAERGHAITTKSLRTGRQGKR